MAFEQLDKFTEAIFNEAIQAKEASNNYNTDLKVTIDANRTYMLLTDVLYKYICTTLSHAKFKGQRYNAHARLKQLNPSFYAGAFPAKSKLK